MVVVVIMLRNGLNLNAMAVVVEEVCCLPF